MWIIVFLITVPLIWALLPLGYYASHDGAFHLVRLIHFYEEIERGQFPVRIATQLAYGYGYPVFNYFYPLANYIGAIIHYLGFDYGSSLKLITGLATFVSVLFYYLWLRCEFKKWPALVGAILSAYIPYRLVAMYVTGSIGIVLSFCFLPMILWSITRMVKNNRHQFSLVLGLVGLILSHNVSALMYAPLIVIYSLILIMRENKFNKIKELIFIGALSLGVGAFFYLPAILEVNYVTLSKGVVVNYFDHFPTFRQLVYSPWGYGYSDGTNGGMSFQVGIAQWIVTLMVFVLFSWFIIKGNFWKKENLLPITFLIIFVFTILSMLSLSVPLWKALPIIQQFQFPWRLLAIIIPVGAYLGSWLVYKLRWWIGIFLVAIAFYGNRNHLRTWELIRYTDSYFFTQTNLFYGSTDIAWELLPIWTEGKIPYIFPEKAVYKGDFESYLEEKPERGERFRLLVESNKEQQVILSLFYFPNWKVYIDDKLLQTEYDVNGLVSIYLPSGKHKLVVRLEETLLQRMTNRISLFSLLLVFVWFLKKTVLPCFKCNFPRKSKV